jgi:superoxide reductase
MEKIGELFQSSDWKSEKHVPFIECPEKIKADEWFNVTVALGKEIAHPNTTEHHIRWIQLLFHPEGSKFTYQIANVEFCTHGEAVDGANAGPVYTHHSATVSMKTKKPGTLFALSLCNIHGLWENQSSITLE